MAAQTATDIFGRTINWDDATDPVVFTVVGYFAVMREAGAQLADAIDTIQAMAP